MGTGDISEHFGEATQVHVDRDSTWQAVQVTPTAISSEFGQTVEKKWLSLTATEVGRSWDRCIRKKVILSVRRE